MRKKEWEVWCKDPTGDWKWEFCDTKEQALRHMAKEKDPDLYLVSVTRECVVTKGKKR